MNRWMPLAQVAECIGVSTRTVEWFVRGSDARGKELPKLASKVMDGKTHAKPYEAYEHCRKHCRRQPPGLMPPPGYEKSQKVTGKGDPDLKLPTGEDLHDILVAITQDQELIVRISPEKLRSLVGLAAELRQKSESDRKLESLLKPDEVTKMLRGQLDQLLHAIGEVRPPRLAADICKALKLTLGIDLVRMNPGAASLLEQVIGADANRVIDGLRSETEDLARGVQALEGTV